MSTAQPIILHVSGIPRPQPRPRVTKTGHAFNPSTDGLKAWKTMLRLAAYKFRPQEPWTQAVRVDVEAFSRDHRGSRTSCPIRRCRCSSVLIATTWTRRSSTPDGA